MLNSVRPVSGMADGPPAASSSINSSSLIENRPMTTTMNWTPSERCTESKVNRYTPEFASTPTVASDNPISVASSAFTG